MRALPILAAVMLQLVVLPIATAAEMPRYVTGQAFIYDNGRVERVHEVEGERVVWAARTGRTYVRNANIIVPILEWTYRGQRGRRVISGDPASLWPLRPGARAQFSAINFTLDSRERTRRSLHLWTCNVRAIQRVEVPAGSFDAFPIVCDRYSPNSMRIVERLTWHYAPDVGHYIRREARDMLDGVGEIYSLYAALPPRAANPARVETLAREAIERRGAQLSRLPPERHRIAD
jgi:hypothetical protein